MHPLLSLGAKKDATFVALFDATVVTNKNKIRNEYIHPARDNAVHRKCMTEERAVNNLLFKPVALAARQSKVAARRVRGFTLLELLVVVAIIGLLASYVGPKYFGVLGGSEQKSALAQIKLLGDAVEIYRLDVGQFPTTQQGLKALMVKPAGIDKWKGPYLKKAIPLDPWNKQYIYRSPGSSGSDFEIISYGSDGQPGGTEIAADLSN